MDDFAEARQRMVARQLRAREIRDERVLAAMAKVPRHVFVPESAGAYDDMPLPIGAGQTISQPFMVAVMAEALALRGHEAVLEVGTGSGYQSAILCELCRQVYSIERIPELAERAWETLVKLGYRNVEIVIGDGTLGLPEHAPYHGIVVSAATPSLSPPWIAQLAEGGRIVAPVGDRWSQMLTIADKQQGEMRQRTSIDCVFVPLIGKYGFQDG
jgi:protein-L-isoaspartate(D-aspartate) O-methyltransferase